MNLNSKNNQDLCRVTAEVFSSVCLSNIFHNVPVDIDSPLI